MKQLTKFFLPVFFLSYALSSKATHIVGGDVTVKSLGSNNFEITLTLLFDCITGSPGAFDPVARMGIFEKGTNAFKDSISVPFVDSLRLQLGDSCFTPTNLCIRRQRYIATINLPNNAKGYYVSWHRCCRNGIITNIANPGASGNVFYAEIADPALANSTPVFSAYPDAYMCVNYPNIDDFSATDADGDSLVYTLVDPYDCAANSICSSSGSGNGPNPGPAPGPYGIVSWTGSYNTTSMMGDPVQSVNSQTGKLSTTPPTQGVFVICVKVEEYRAGVKIGEIRRDVQYAVIPCTIPSVTLSGPNPICLGDSTTLIASGGTNYSWSTGATTNSLVVAPTATGTYTFSVYTAVNPTCHTSANISIDVKPSPVIVASGNATICIGSSTPLSASGAGSGTYVWSPSGSLNNSNISNPVATPLATTSYVVTGTDANGCKNKDTVLVNVGIEPEALFGSSSALSCDGIYVQFTDSSINATSWYWIFSDGSTSIQQHPGHLFPFDNSVYSVTLVVTNPPCQDSLVSTIPTSSFITISPANVFTPNGDGKNDCFHPVLAGGSADSLAQCIRLEIFDRWGKKMFESDGVKTCWDGTNRNNKQVVDGTYYYIAELGETKIKGFVEVMR